MLSRFLLSLAVMAGLSSVLCAQDGTSEAPRNSSPFVLPTDSPPGGAYVPPADPAVVPNDVPPPEYPTTNAAPVEALIPDRSARRPGEIESHPVPGAKKKRPGLALPPPPANYGVEEPATPTQEPLVMPIPNDTAAPVPPASPYNTDAYPEVKSAEYTSPGNHPLSTDVQQASGTSAPLASVPTTIDSPALPLAPQSNKDRSLKPGSLSGNSPMVISVMAALGAVIGLFLIVAWGARKTLPGSSGRLPPEVLEPLGRMPLSAKTELQLLRLGSKLILVSSTAGAAERVCEVTDPLEVERLLALCKKGKPGSSTAAFRETLSQVSSEPARGFAGEFARANPGAATQRRAG